MKQKKTLKNTLVTMFLALAVFAGTLLGITTEARAADAYHTISNGASYEMTVGDTMQLYYSRNYYGILNAWTWIFYTDDGDIDDYLTVERDDQNCYITALKPTTITLEATYTYKMTYSSSTSSKTYTCTITVNSDLSAPTITGVSNTSSGVKLTWNTVSGANGYSIYKEQSDGTFSRIDMVDSDDTSFTDSDVEMGETYSYYITAVDCYGTTGIYESEPSSTYSQTWYYVGKPYWMIVTSATDGNGIYMAWVTATNATGYDIYRKTSSGSTYSKIASTTSGYYTDTTVSSGTTYYYKIVATCGSYCSDYSDAKSITYTAVPTISGISKTTKGVSLTWGSVTGATKYTLYRAVSGGSFAALATTTSTSYTDTTVSTGKKYYYKVSATGSSYEAKGLDYVSITYVKTPTMSSVKNTSSGIKVSWKSVSKATSYYVYRKTSGGSYSKLTETTSTSYTDTTAKNGTTYYYKVKACYKLSSGSNTVSAASSLKKLRRISTSSVKSVSNNSAGIKITWSKNSKATGYIIYRKTGSSGSWEKVKTVTSSSTTSYKDTTAKNGKTYYYRVRSYYKSSSGTKTYSAYSSSKKLRCLSTPTVKSVSNKSSGVKVTWSKNSKATGYVIYRRTASGSWKKIKTVSSASTTSYTDKTAKDGTTYYYSVKAIYKTSSKTYYSGRSSSKKIKAS